MRILLLTATARGERFLRELAAIAPDADIEVVTFREEPWEPPFVENLARAAEQEGAAFRLRRAGEPLDETPFDLLFAVNWRFFVPESVYSRARLGAWVLHDSLLPRYRGFSPTVWAIVNGEDHTGISLLQMASNIDQGGIVSQQRVEIGPEDTIGSVMEAVTEACLALLRTSFPRLLDGVSPEPQDESLATWACKRLPEDNRIDWTQPTRRILDLIRGVTRPYPGAWTMLEERRLTIWSATAERPSRAFAGRIPGRIVSLDPVSVLTGDGVITLLEMQGEDATPGPASSLRIRMSATLR